MTLTADEVSTQYESDDNTHIDIKHHKYDKKNWKKVFHISTKYLFQWPSAKLPRTTELEAAFYIVASSLTWFYVFY